MHDRLCAAYMEPAGRSSASRCASVGRRSSGDIAASLNNPLDMGIGSLGARPQPIWTASRAVSVDRRAADVSMGAGSSHGTEASALDARRLHYGQMQSSRETTRQDRGLGRRAYPDSSSGSSVSGRSSLVDRSSSGPTFEDAGTASKAQSASVDGAVAGLALGDDSTAQSTSGQHGLSR